MSIDLKPHIGRLLVVGIPGTRLDRNTRELLVDLRVGGVILFGRNVRSPRQVHALTKALHALPSRPLVSIDHEGGRVARLREPFTTIPPAAEIGRYGDPKAARAIGEIIGRELSSVGIDVDYAPVLDVHSNPDNPVIGDRAFASDPEAVAGFGVAMMRGLNTGGVIPCGKHFPGHGDTATDSHHVLPVVRRSRVTLSDVELAPFRSAVAAGIPMIMTAHVLYPVLDRSRAATVSPRIIGELLRKAMRFRGVIASDDLHRGAIAGNRSIATAAVEALDAGVDWLLVCHDLTEARNAAAAIQAAVDNGTLSRRQILAASRRIAALMQRHRRRRRKTCRLPNVRHQRILRTILGSRTQAK